ncbi:carboxymuconolactone decarboxylase family protein [Microbacterium sp. gxy059]|uniref:carboxymuconolactone decarboxylase family protein n=1 Tax=Microbacterium sp. gxy059 TaxID=2957199 RepID=UPI003D98062B
MSRSLRIPEARISGPSGAILSFVARRMWGRIPDNARVLWHHRRVMNGVLGIERSAARWKALDPHLASYATMATAGVIGCSWCLDFGYFLAHDEGLDLAKVREVPRWRESDAFSETEREVMAYAEAMTATPPEATDEQAERLLAALGAPALVELTQLIALENMRSRFNAAVGLESQGFSAVCELPLAVASSA